MAGPDGASTLASWCISTTSAVSKCGAASSAKRIISPAPIAKLGATRRAAPVGRDRGELVEVGGGQTGRAHHGVDPVLCAPGELARAAFATATVKSTATSAFAGRERLPLRGDGEGRLRDDRAGRARVDGRHQLDEVGGVEHGAVRPSAPIRPPAPRTPTRITARQRNPRHATRTLPTLGGTSTAAVRRP